MLHTQKQKLDFTKNHETWFMNIQIDQPLSLSNATTCPIPSTSRAYLRALNPVADRAYWFKEKTYVN